MAPATRAAFEPDPIAVRTLHPGMGQAVAERTVLRKKFPDLHERMTVAATDPNLKVIQATARRRGQSLWVDHDPDAPHMPWRFETWGEVADRVAMGNAALLPSQGRDPDEWGDECQVEYEVLRRHIALGSVLMSGRHLQHGDHDQPGRNMEVFTNCATAPTSFLLFLLLLNGSGVGRCYDEDMMLVNWDHAPTVRCVLDEDHPDFDPSAHESARDARHKYRLGSDVLWFEVPDTREGWAKALEMWEVAAFEKVHQHKMLVLDFSKVRPCGELIRGMQDRPSSGPVPLMNAFAKAMTIRGAGLKKWAQAMYIDHYFAECVLVGGARRAARMSTMWWRDPNIFDFIVVKRPVEFYNMTVEEVAKYRRGCTERGENPPSSFLWSSNNSVAVDEEFWRYVHMSDEEARRAHRDGNHDVLLAREVFQEVTACAYGDGTGEPGFINVDKLVQKDEGWSDLEDGGYVGSRKYTVQDNTRLLLSRLAKRALGKPLHMITNPCGEITLCVLGGYCVLCDVAPLHCEPGELRGVEQRVGEYGDEWDRRVEEAVRASVRALIRVNTMDAIYHKEVRRTNRIGVAMTGIHEWAWARFGYGFRDLINEAASWPFWRLVERLSRAVHDEAVMYSEQLGLPVPHTMTTLKPSGTISKLFGLTEGAHLPAMARYVRWVQFHNDDPLVDKYRRAGYPVRVLKRYEGHTIVGFPTQPVIGGMGMGGALVLAGDATMEEQFRWVKLLEYHWLEGGDAWHERYGNEVSYTLKYRPEDITFEQFREAIMKWQPEVRCCTVMPQEEVVSYEYQPEEPVTEARYEQLCRAIEAQIAEDVGREHLECDGGVCPVDFGQVKGEAFIEGSGI